MSSKFPGCPNDPNGPSPPGDPPFFPPYVAPPPPPPPPPPEPPPPPPDPDDPLPPSDPPGDGGDNDPGGEPGENALPTIVGDVEWFQDFSNLVVGPNDLDQAGNRYGNDPGIVRQGGNLGTTNYVVTMSDTILGKRILELQQTKEAKEKEGANHTEIELWSERYFTGGKKGRSLIYGKDYKLSFVHNLKLGYDFDLPNQDSFNIMWQSHSFADSGDESSRNPIIAFTFIDGGMYITTRGDSLNPTTKPYQFDETFFLYNPVFNEYELIEAFFTFGHAVGTAKLQIFRNGIQVFNDQSTRIGYNNTSGFHIGMGIYHNFNGTSNADVLRRRLSAIRIEAM